MTDATSRPRALRALAVAGAFGIALSPMMGATAFAAPGTVKILQPGEAQESNANNPQIDGCSFDVRIDGADPATYSITFDRQAPTDVWPNVQGAPTTVVGADDESVTESYKLIGAEGVTYEDEDFHIKVFVTDSGDASKVSSKVFWVRDCVPEPFVPVVDKPEVTVVPEVPVDDKPETEDEVKPSTEASVPGAVNSGIDGGNGGIVAMGLGGVAIAGLAALGLRRRTRA